MVMTEDTLSHIQWAEVRDAVNPPARHKKVLQKRNQPAPHANSVCPEQGLLDTHALDGLGRFTGVLEVNTEILTSWIAPFCEFLGYVNRACFGKNAGSLPIKPLKQKEINKHS